MSDIPKISYRLEYKSCGKGCKTCRTTKGHGPYCYGRWREKGERYCLYISKKNITPEILAALSQNSTPTPPLSIQTFGGLQVWRGREELYPLQWGDGAFRLFRMLFEGSIHGIPCTHLAEALSPDATPAQSQRSYRSALKALQQGLGAEHYLEQVEGYLRLVYTPREVAETAVSSRQPKGGCDIQSFSQAAKGACTGRGTGKARTAVAFATGPYLAGLEYYPGVAQKQEELKNTVVALWCHIARIEMRAGHFEQAIEALEAALHAHPSNEKIARKLFTCYGKSGQTNEIRHTYNRLCRALAEDDVKPESRTMKIVEDALKLSDTFYNGKQAESTLSIPNAQQAETLRLAGKIAPPSRSIVLPREELLKELTQTVQKRRASAIIAPGGAGKTTLLVDWMQQSTLPVAWYRLDTTDRDLTLLVKGLTAAIARVLAPLGWVPPLPPIDKEPAERALSRLLVSVKAYELVLVLDDVHQLEESQQLISFFYTLTQYRPASIVPLLLARPESWLSDNLAPLYLFHDFDLLLCLEEAEQLLALQGMDPAAAAQVVSQEGGTAGAVLFAGWLQTHQRIQETLTEEARIQALERLAAGEDSYLVFNAAESSVFQSLPSELQTFVLETAPLGILTPADADAILERTDSAQCYAALMAQGIFMEQSEGTYRYHDLFSAHVTAVLQAQDPARLRAIRRAGAAWWEQQGVIARAVALLIDNKYWELLAALIERARHILWHHTMWNTALLAIEHLPHKYHSAIILTLQGYIYLYRGKVEEVWEKIAAARTIAQDDRERLQPALLELEALQQSGRDDRVIQHAQTALTHAQRLNYPAAIARFQELLGISLMRSGQVAQGLMELRTALIAHKQALAVHEELRVSLNIAVRLEYAGQVAESEHYLTQAETLAQESQNQINIGYIPNARALLYLLRGDFSAARESAEEAQGIGWKLGYRYLDCLAKATLAEVAADAAMPDAAELAQEAAELADDIYDRSSYHDAMRAWVIATLHQHNYARAQELVLQTYDNKEYPLGPVDAALFTYLEGLLALCKGEDPAAATLLADAAQRLEQMSYLQHAARATLLLAEALYRTDRHENAENLLNRLPELTAPQSGPQYLQPITRWVTQVQEKWPSAKHLHEDTIHILEALFAAAAPLAGMHHKA